MLDATEPRHIWDAIELVHRKALNESVRRHESHTETASTAAVSTRSRAGAAEIEETDRELRLVTDARRQYKELYERPVDEAEEK
jgi:hypothetical protein